LHPPLASHQRRAIGPNHGPAPDRQNLPIAPVNVADVGGAALRVARGFGTASAGPRRRSERGGTDLRWAGCVAALGNTNPAERDGMTVARPVGPIARRH